MHVNIKIYNELNQCILNSLREMMVNDILAMIEVIMDIKIIV